MTETARERIKRSDSRFSVACSVLCSGCSEVSGFGSDIELSFNRYSQTTSARSRSFTWSA